MSAALNACSTGFMLRPLQRTQSKRDRHSPMASADSGSKQFVASTRAQNCSLPVTCASNDSSSDVLPEVIPAGAHICVSAPLGICLLYTSDAADERSSVDLGG